MTDDNQVEEQSDGDIKWIGIDVSVVDAGAGAAVVQLLHLQM